MAHEPVVALCGNPNSGKTTLFNALTGSHQYVGNWPGVTVERKEGHAQLDGLQLKLVDLPGTYSLTPYSQEEIVARRFIIEDHPDAVVVVVDASNLERSLNLVLQVLELERPTLLVLNMYDLARQDGLEIDIATLSRLLGVPIVATIASRNEGLDELQQTLLELLNHKDSARPHPFVLRPEVEQEAVRVEAALAESGLDLGDLPKRWVTLKLLEGDELVRKQLEAQPAFAKLAPLVDQARRRLQEHFGEDPETILVDARFGLVNGLVREVTKRIGGPGKYALSDKLDAVVMSNVVGFPLFALVMWLLFEATFKLSAPANDWLQGLFSNLADLVKAALSAYPWLASLVSDGILGGVGAILSFVPSIFALFFLLAILEDSGYLARVAFLSDRLMHRLGLHGKSFIPLLLGFGCNVPAVMATRTLEHEKDRLLTMLIVPLISCSARLPIYVLLASALFSEHAGSIVFMLYALSLVVAFLVGLLFRKTLFKTASPAFIMELPPYMVPTLRGLLTHTWDRGKYFLSKAGTVILAASVILWVIASLPAGVEYASEPSYLGQLGKLAAPLLKPCGFGFWQAAVALLAGFAAKELVVSTFGALFSAELAGKLSLTQVMAHHFTPASGLAFMVFVLLYVPCVATIAAIKAETASWRWPIFVVVYTTALAWMAALVIYQIGHLLAPYLPLLQGAAG